MGSLRKAYYLHHLMRSQWKSYEELRELQDKKLRAIIKHAYENVPFYRQKFDSAGVKPEHVKTVDDLPKLPVTTKQEVRDNFPDRILAKSVDVNKCWLPRTSGSTGIPLTVAYDDQAEDFEKAVALRANLSCGQKLRDKWVVIISPDHIQPKKWFQRFGIFSPIGISLFTDVREQMSIIEKISADIIDGYSSSIYLLAKEAMKGNFTVRPKVVFGTAEVLTEGMRATINSAFRTRMFDQFGCVEFNRTAWECPAHNGYHIDVEAVVMEFIKAGKAVAPGEWGEIIYTGLYNYAMPLIRYAVGDIAIPSDKKCSCGRGLPLMKSVKGRADAFIQVPNGRIFSPIIWTILLRPYDLEQFKVIQEKIDRIKIQIMPRRKFGQEAAANIEESVKNALGREVEIDVEAVNNIPREGSGKIRAVMSKVKIDW